MPTTKFPFMFVETTAPVCGQLLTLCSEVCQCDYGDHIHDTCQTAGTGVGSSVGKVQGQLSVLGRVIYICSAC